MSLYTDMLICIAAETLYTNVMPLVGSVSYDNKKQGAKLTYVAMLAGHVNQGVKIITKTHDTTQAINTP